MRSKFQTVGNGDGRCSVSSTFLRPHLILVLINEEPTDPPLPKSFPNLPLLGFNFEIATPFLEIEVAVWKCVEMNCRSGCGGEDRGNSGSAAEEKMVVSASSSSCRFSGLWQWVFTVSRWGCE